MRTTRIYTPIYIALLFAAIGCDKNYDQPATGQNDIVMFAASLAGTANGADSGNTPQTKGVLLNTGTTDISLQPGIIEFNVAAYDGTTRFIPATNATNGYETVTYSNSKWATQTTYFWPGSSNKTFYAYANMPNDLNTNGGPSISCTSTGQVLTGFTINDDDYTAQQDILMGYYSGNGKGASAVERTAAIKFYHPLTAVRFKMDTETGVTINSLKSIEIKDIYSSGKVSQSGTTFTWSDFGETTNVTMSPQSPSTTLAVNETTKLISNGRDETFILIPQNLEDQNVIINVVASIDGSEDKTFTGTLSTGAWEAGTVYTYELRIDKFKLQVVKVDEWKNNNSYNRSDDITRGAALMTGFVEKLYKSISQAKYGDSDHGSKADIKTISFQTGMPLEDEAVIQRYDNELKVIPGWSRSFSEKDTDEEVVYMEKIQEDQYTLYKRSEPIYSFCDADGNCIICTTADVIYFPISCESLFDGCTELTSITGITGGTTIPGDGFTSGTALTDGLSNVRTDHTTSMKRMFYNCKKLESLNLPFNTSEVTNMLYMFGNCTSLTALNVPFNTSKVNDMQYTFYNCKLQKIDGIENWSGESVMYASGMFYNCSKLSGKLDLSHFVTTNKLQRVNDMFCGCGNVTEIDLSGLITSGVTHMSSMFEDCEKLETITGISNWDVKAVTSTSRMFYNCSGLTNKFDLSSFETTSNLKDIKEMFSGCGNVTEIDLSKLDTSGVTDMSYMFEGCSKLKSIVGTSNWSGAAVTTTFHMFYNCLEMTSKLDLSGFITSTSLTNVSYMFYNCKISELDISSLNTSNVENFQGFLYECTNLGKLTVGTYFTIKSGANLKYMVYHVANDITKCTVICPSSIKSDTWENIIATNSSTTYYKSSKFDYQTM